MAVSGTRNTASGKRTIKRRLIDVISGPRNSVDPRAVRVAQQAMGSRLAGFGLQYDERGALEVGGSSEILDTLASEASSTALVSLMLALLRSPYFLLTNATASYTMAPTDVGVAADSSGGAMTVTLPAAVNTKGRLWTFKRYAGGSAVTIAPPGSETIDGAANLSLSALYDSACIYSDGSNFWTV